MSSAVLEIRPMRPAEIGLAVDWAAAEGWNPGLADSSCFGTVDPAGFLIGEIERQPVAMISCVNYDTAFSFLGFYIVRQDMRGHGHGLEIWRAALAHAGTRTIGLDGVVSQQANYMRSGFLLAHRNVRYGGAVARSSSKSHDADVAPLSTVPLSTIEAQDRSIFPAPRQAFLKAWVAAPGHLGRALVRDGDLAAWGVVRPCRAGHKVGPLVASSQQDAERLVKSLIDASSAETIYLDVPAPNLAGAALATSLGLAPVFETARMYRGRAPALDLGRLFGMTTFELG